MTTTQTAADKADASVVLEQELETFKKELPALLQKAENRGKLALVYRDAVHGLYGSVEEALAAGYDLFGLNPFLVKEVTEHERPLYCSRNRKRCR
jgi:hypothetical protein